MSVRATERLIGDLVIVSAIPNSPRMIVKAIDAETKLITTSWFSGDNAYQEGFFPANALDRVDPVKTIAVPKKAKKSGAKTVPGKAKAKRV